MDAARMEQVLINLLANAVQASSEGGAIDAEVAREGDQLVYRVRDRGEGLGALSEAELEALFEPFRTERVRGTGLGLAVARRIVEAHGGRITAANHPEGGALFTVRLPAGQLAAGG